MYTMPVVFWQAIFGFSCAGIAATRLHFGARLSMPLRTGIGKL
jgi:hypothetical protein